MDVIWKIKTDTGCLYILSFLSESLPIFPKTHLGRIRSH